MDETHFLQLLEDIKDRLYNYARKMLYSAADADDVFSDAVLSMWEQRANFTLGTNFKAWAFKVLLNKIYNCNRKANLARGYVQANAPSDEDEYAQPDSRQAEDILRDPSTWMEFCHDDVKRAFDLLNPSEKETLLLQVVGDLSYAEIAATTGAPEPTVMTRLARAKKKMRLALSNHIKTS
ncbi:MAG: RNA polymerase sigma factor [Planctomycetota bacterium]